MSFPQLRSYFNLYGRPTVSTQDVSSITDTTATGNGTVLSIGISDLTERGVCWSTLVNPTISDSKDTSAGQLGAFTVSITGLSAVTTYYVRAYATNTQGTSYGENVTFTSSASAGGVFIMSLCLMGVG